MSDAIISAKNVDLVFETSDDTIEALKDVSVDIFKGDFVSLIGPSGCGKTTLLRAIASLETPNSGHLSVNGMSPDAARKSRAYGYVFQAAGLYPWRNIAKNISLPLEIMGYRSEVHIAVPKKDEKELDAIMNEHNLVEGDFPSFTK